MAEVLTRHQSPDGELTLLAEHVIDPDGSTTIAVGFEGLAWHVHPELFMAPLGRSLEQMALDLVSDVIHDRMLIVCVTTTAGRTYRLVESVDDEIDYKSSEAILDFRFWSGRRVSLDQLIGGEVSFKPL